MSSVGAPGRNGTVAGMPPALLLGGTMGNALSVARSLGRQGIDVYLLGDPDAPERHSRYIRYLSVCASPTPAEAWAAFLLGPESHALKGAVLLACSDVGIELIMKHRDQLERRFVLDISNQKAQESLLNKLATYRLAAVAGVPTPRFWAVRSMDDVRAHRAEYVYPLMLKPLYSHTFSAVFQRKFLLAEDEGQLLKAYEAVQEHDLEVVLLEVIPGPDNRLCSYYTYMDEGGQPLFHYTKRVVRRYPVNQGLACYHITDWNPEVRDLGLRLLAHAGHLGLANVEFKRDNRDGKLKIIECNARFTAANGLVAASGYDLGIFVYNRLVGRPQRSLEGKPYKLGLRMWDPGRDFLAFLDLRARGELTLTTWLSDLLHPMVFRYFRWYDPLPALVSLTRLPHRAVRFAARRVPGRRAGAATHRAAVAAALAAAGDIGGTPGEERADD